MKAMLRLCVALLVMTTACSTDAAPGIVEPPATTPPSSAPVTTGGTATAPSTTGSADPSTPPEAAASDGCGHDVDPAVVRLGFNEVVDADGAVKSPQGRPFQEGDALRATATEVTDPNTVAYAQIAAFMMPIRDALMCDLGVTTVAAWLQLTEVLTLNGIKTEQDLSGAPPDQVYSTTGIFDHLRNGEDFHPMMKYLEEAELELKCLAFEGFDFTNPDGDNHCEIHGLAEGSGLILP